MFVPAYPTAKYHSRTKYMVNVRTSVPNIPLSRCQIPFRYPFQVYGKCSYQRTKYPIAKYHYVTLSITQSPIPLTLRHPFHHLKPYQLTLRYPVHHLKSYPIDSQSTAQHSDPFIPEYKISHCQISLLSPFPSFKFLSQQQPTNVLFQ